MSAPKETDPEAIRVLVELRLEALGYERGIAPLVLAKGKPESLDDVLAAIERAAAMNPDLWERARKDKRRVLRPDLN